MLRCHQPTVDEALLITWYVPVTDRATGRMAIGVGVSDGPTGPFRDALGRPLVENGEIDPTEPAE